MSRSEAGPLRQQGFSLVELIAVMVIAGVLAAITLSRGVSQQPFLLQAGRETLVSALFLAQQKAMSQTRAVQLTTAGAQVDIRIDSNGDGSFSPAESVLAGGQQYPVKLPGGVTVDAHQVAYDRLGRTPAITLTLRSQSATLPVQVSATGFAH